MTPFTCGMQNSNRRTHQIRVHFSANGHPLAGDTTYGYRARLGGVRFFPRVMLHAWKLSIEHPESREAQNFCAPLLKIFLRALPVFRTEATIR